MKIKLCGMFRECDIDFVNEAMPDFIGFILNFPKSHRNISLDTAEKLKKRLDSRIKAVGVFVNASPELCAESVKRGISDLVQLHGSENAEYIQKLRGLIGNVPIIKAVKVTTEDDIQRAGELAADYLLLDSGTGTGKAFDHKIIRKSKITVPFFLAGGITPENIAEAAAFGAYAADLSSGIETDGLKDREKIIKAVKAARSCG